MRVVCLKRHKREEKEVVWGKKNTKRGTFQSNYENNSAKMDILAKGIENKEVFGDSLK